jgi:hypothetical protein
MGGEFAGIKTSNAKHAKFIYPSTTAVLCCGAASSSHSSSSSEVMDILAVSWIGSLPYADIPDASTCIGSLSMTGKRLKIFYRYFHTDIHVVETLSKSKTEVSFSTPFQDRLKNLFDAYRNRRKFALFIPTLYKQFNPPFMSNFARSLIF